MMAMLSETSIIVMTVIALTIVRGLPLVVDEPEERNEKNMRWINNEDSHVQKRPCSKMTPCGDELPVHVIRRNNLHNGTALANKMNEGVKKNVFTSRGWGAGGMPFSVLYLNRKARVHYQPQARQPVLGEAMPQPLALTEERPQHPGYQKVAQRNTLNSRRHYSIIPQLFVSYGWGPIGK